MNKPSMSRREFLCLSASALAGALLAACKPAEKLVEVEKVVKETVVVPGATAVPGSKVVEIEFWNGIGAPDGNLMQDFMNRFEDTRSDVKITQWTTDWDPFYTKIRATYAEGIGPDIAVAHPPYLAQYADTVFKPIDELVAADSYIKPTIFAETPWKRTFVKGKQYAVPMDVHCLGLYLNVGMIEQAGLSLPKTEADLVAVAKALTKAPDRYGFFTHYKSVMMLWEWIGHLAHFGQKGLLSEDNTKAAFNNDAGVQALQRMYDNIYTDKISWGPSEGLDDYQAFMSGACGMRVGGNWEKFSWDSAKDLQYTSSVFMPDQPGTWGSSHTFVFPQMGPREETMMAWEAAKWVIQNCSVEWSLKMGHTPALLEAAQSPDVTSVKEMQGFRDSVPYVNYLPHVPQHEQISETMVASLGEVLQNVKGVAEALKEAEAKVNDILSKA